MNSEIQQADERHRIRWLIALTLVAVLGAFGIIRLDAYLNGLHAVVAEARPAAMAKARLVVRAILALIATAGIVFSLYMGTTSWRIYNSERYPPPGARVFSDTRIYRGQPARRRGQIGLALAVIMLLLTLAVVSRANRVFSRLLDTTLRPTRVEIGALPVRAPIGRGQLFQRVGGHVRWPCPDLS